MSNVPSTDPPGSASLQPTERQGPPPERSGAGPSPYAVLAVSLVGLSVAAPLVRLSAAPPAVISVWRLAFAMVVITAVLIPGRGWREWGRLTRPELMMTIAAGVLLALHFWSWNASLRYTTIAASVTLVNLQPILIALVSARWLGERASRRQWIGITIGVVGVVAIGLADLPVAGTAELPSMSSASRNRALLGDVLALFGAVTAAAYYLIGRRIRQTLDLWPYVGLVYGTACITSLLIVLVTDSPLRQPPRELAIFAGLAAGPMLIGHTGLNWALAHLPAFVVNLTVLGEPVGATLIGALMPGIAEIPSGMTLLGGAMVLGGVLLASRTR